MKAYVLAGFPESVEPYFASSMMAKASERGKLDVRFLNLYDYAKRTGGRIDDRPFGGGAGTLLRPEPIALAVDEVMAAENGKVLPVYMGPRGVRLTQPRVEALAKTAEKKALLVLCGHYEGVDERVLERYGFRVYSVGDFVLSSGELAAAVLLDAVARLVPGTLANADSPEEESFSKALGRRREYPHFTRPADWRGHAVPETLLSGNHAHIARWRKENLK